MKKKSPPKNKIPLAKAAALTAADATVISDGDGITFHNLKVLVAKSPLAVDWWIRLEGVLFQMGDFRFNGKFWEREFPQFPVNGTLDVVLEGRGLDDGVNRGVVTSRVISDGTLPGRDLRLETVKGYGVDRESYHV